MAKTNGKKTATLSAGTRKMIADIKRPFMAYVNQFAGLAETRAQLAPKFMKIFGKYTSEIGGNFVDFVRVLDPNTPNDRAEYRIFKSYTAADYLRRLAGRRDTGTNRAKPVRSNLAIMARLLATIQPLVSDGEAFWKGIAGEFGLTARQVTKLRQVVSSAQPIIRITVPHPVPARIVHVTPEGEASPRAATRRAA